MYLSKWPTPFRFPSLFQRAGQIRKISGYATPGMEFFFRDILSDGSHFFWDRLFWCLSVRGFWMKSYAGARWGLLIWCLRMSWKVQHTQLYPLLFCQSGTRFGCWNSKMQRQYNKTSLIIKNTNTIFLSAVNECELILMVYKFKNKNSTNCQDIDKSTVKRVINHISKPLTYICNSNKLGPFQTKWKLLK